MKSKKAKIIAGVIGGVIIAVALTLFVTLYLVPYNEVKVEYNTAREQYDIEATALENINKELISINYTISIYIIFIKINY